ncbi:histidine kinase [Micromonospora kangleipakensis]|uniref:histidine kinase n=1 Tax=Micromonospora kangleipakensis TaxID=1077942 RepID=A0A4Q8BFF0_9ACTN|nr:histidine kinase [Micromonospora kangleipakensis]RZU76115.1 histidine kinase [Micromonospora kangleipakensis]
MPFRLTVGGAGLLLGGLSLWLAANSEGYSFAADAPWALILYLTAGWLTIAAGVLRWGRRPALLLVLVAIAWFVAEWDSPLAGSALTFTTALCLGYAGPAVVGHLTLVDMGRSRWNVPLAAVGYVATIALLGVLPTVYFDPASQGCPTCPDNLVVLADDAGALQRTAQWGMRIGLAWAVVVMVVVTARLVRATPVRRRRAAPVVAGGGAYLVASAWTFLINFDRGHLGHTALESRLWAAQGIALIVLAATFVAELVRARRTHAYLARLVVDVAAGSQPGRLRDAVAERVGDPGLEVAYPLDVGGYVDAAGHPLLVPADGRRTTRLAIGDHEFAVLVHRPGLLDDPVLVAELIGAGHLGLESAGLRARTLAVLEDVRASRLRLIEAGDTQRVRLERDLHDGAQQRLVALSFALSVLRSRAGEDGERLYAAVPAVQAALDQLRALARGISPVVLREEGLAAALTSLAETAPLRLLDLPEGRFPDLVETTAYLLVARAAAAGPTDAAVTMYDDDLVLDLVSPCATEALDDVPDRISSLGGRLTVEPGADGTNRLAARIPVTQ